MKRSLMLVWAILAMTGCDRRVRVLDDWGRPLPGVEISAATLTLNCNNIMTDADGYAEVPQSILVQDVQWVSLHASGYKTLNIDARTGIPGLIMLHRE